MGMCCPRKLRRRLAVAKSDRRVARQARGQPIGGAECPPCQVGPPVLQKDESTHLIGDGAFRLEIDALGAAGQSIAIGRASCRARVCQALLISVLAGSLNKKKI